MKNMIIPIVLILAGCGSVPMAGPQVVKFNGQRIYQGQSNDSITQALGPPDVVSMGSYPKNAWAGGVWFTPGIRTVEWCYISGSQGLIIWLDAGTVGRVCLVPAVKIRR